MERRAAAHLRRLARAAAQPANRWDGFDTGAPEAHGRALRFQIAFAGMALAALAARPDADDEERAEALAALGALPARMAQRRVWAYWSGPIAERGYNPDPVAEGNLEFSGNLALLMALHQAAGGDGPAEPLALVWSSSRRYSYGRELLFEALVRQMAASPVGGVPCGGDEVHPPCMAAALLALGLYDGPYAAEAAGPARLWLATLEQRLLLGGPRLPGRGALARSIRRDGRGVAPLSDPLSDVWALALLAPLAPGLARRGAERAWPDLRRLAAGKAPERALEAAFGYALAVELGEAELAGALRAWADRVLEPREDEAGALLLAGAGPAAEAVFALGDAGGLGGLVRQRGRHGAALAGV